MNSFLSRLRPMSSWVQLMRALISAISDAFCAAVSAIFKSVITRLNRLLWCVIFCTEKTIKFFWRFNAWLRYALARLFFHCFGFWFSQCGFPCVEATQHHVINVIERWAVLELGLGLGLGLGWALLLKRNVPWSDWHVPWNDPMPPGPYSTRCGSTRHPW